jgi:hypothetical protein
MVTCDASVVVCDGHPCATAVWRSAHVLVWLKGGSWQRDRICRMDGEPRPFGELFGFAVTHWSAVNSPTEGAT